MKKLLLAIFLLFALIPFAVKSVPTLPLNTEIERKSQWIQNAAESSWFVWNSELHYLFTDRDSAGTSKRMKVIKPTFDANGKITSQTVISTFGEGYGCQDVLVSGSTLYVFTTGCWMDYSHQQNPIVKFTSTDLTDWSGPTTIYTPEPTAQLYNVGIIKNTSTNTWVISYDVHNQYWYAEYFVTRFLTASDIAGSWTDFGAGNVLRSYGAADLQFIDGAYYLFVNESFANLHQTILFKTTDLINFTCSRLHVMHPIFEYEDINTTDLDLFELNGKVHITYLTADQATYMRLNYATYAGTMSQLIDVYYQP